MTDTPPNRLNIADPDGFWFFAYGSLMWDPPFTPARTEPARLLPGGYRGRTTQGNRGRRSF